MYIECAETLDAISILEPELFDELFLLETETERITYLIKLEERAKVLGVKSKFDRIYKARERDFKAEQKRQQQITPEIPDATHVTDFSGQEKILECGSWLANDNGVYILTDKGMACACSHPIYPDAILVNAETGEYKIVLKFKVHGRWRETIESRDIIASSNKIISLAAKGVRVTSENARALVMYLSEVEAKNEDVVTEHVSTSRLGWIGSTFMPYEKDIVFDNEENLRSLFKSIHTCGSREKWYKCIEEIRQEKRFELQIYFAASLASVLVEPCGTLPFIVSLWGGTGLGKTVALMLATSIWADPNEGAYMTDAKATSTAMEIRLDCLNSLPMTLDDMAQIKNQFDGDFSELVYRWCAGKGRDRSNQSLGLNKLTNWRNCTLTNGERSLISETMQGGAVNRIIDVEIDNKPLFADGNKTSKILRKNYGFMGAEFIELLQQIGFDELNKRAEAKIALLRETAKAKNQEKEDKQIMPMALILLADELAEHYIFKDGIRLDVGACCDLLKNKGEVSEHKRAYEYLKDIITSQSFHFADNDAETIRQNTELYGYWLNSEKLVIIGTIFDRLLEQGGFQSRAFLSWCRKNNLVECDSKGNFKKQIKINGINNRCVVLRLIDIENGDFSSVVADELPFD
ncbi:MAG: DUF927 domain-containing protein [Bacteroidales bacterium]|nr:DUF927 domain-containing protein [Bacteroidales bacterium]